MSSNNQSPSIPKKTRLRFRDEDDLIFLREVLGYNPFRQSDLWAVIQEHVFAATGKHFSIKTLKDHLDLLIKIWLEKTKKYKDRYVFFVSVCFCINYPDFLYKKLTCFQIWHRRRSYRKRQAS